MRGHTRTMLIAGLIATGLLTATPASAVDITVAPRLNDTRSAGQPARLTDPHHQLAPNVPFVENQDAFLPGGNARASIVSAIRTAHALGLTELRVDGFTDSQGSAAWGYTLGLLRARAVAGELRTIAGATGLPALTIRLASYGEHFPLNGNANESQMRANRRVELHAVTATGPTGAGAGPGLAPDRTRPNPT